jgi:hypothetical protein
MCSGGVFGQSVKQAAPHLVSFGTTAEAREGIFTKQNITGFDGVRCE